MALPPLFDDEETTGAQAKALPPLFDDEETTPAKALPPLFDEPAHKPIPVGILDGINFGTTSADDSPQTGTQTLANAKLPPPVEHVGKYGTLGEVASNVGDAIEGGVQGIKSLIPGTDRRDNPAYDSPGLAGDAYRMNNDVLRSTAALAGGTVAAGGNPLGGVAAIAADRAGQIYDEDGAQAFKKPSTYADLAVTAATADLPLRLGPGISRLADSVAKNALVRGATKIGLTAGLDTTTAAAQAAADLYRRGIDINSPEGQEAMKRSMLSGLAVSVPASGIHAIGEFNSPEARSTRAGWDNETPVVTPQRAAEIQQAVEDQIGGEQSIARQVRAQQAEEKIARQNAQARAEIAATEQKAMQTKEQLDAERAAVAQVQSEQAIRDKANQAGGAAYDSTLQNAQPPDPEHVAQADAAAQDAYNSALQEYDQIEAQRQAMAPKQGAPVEGPQIPAEVAAKRRALGLGPMLLPAPENSHSVVDATVPMSDQIGMSREQYAQQAANDARAATLKELGVVPTSGFVDGSGNGFAAGDNFTVGKSPEAQASEAARVAREKAMQEQSQAPPEGQKLLPAPSPESLTGYTSGENPGVHVGSNDGMPDAGQQLPSLNFDEEVSQNGSGEREVQGQTPGVTPQTEVTPAPQAGEGVINQGGQAAGSYGLSPLGLGRVSARTNGASEPIKPATGLNPDLGELKTSTLQDEGTQQAVNNMSYTDAEDMQAARRGTVPVQQSIDTGMAMAAKQGEKLIAQWKPGKAFNSEELAAIKAHTQGVTQKLAEVQAEYDKTGDPKTQEMLFDLNRKQFEAARVVIAGKSEAGRALRILRETIAPVQYDPTTGQPVKQAAGGNTISPTDKGNAIDYLTKLYGDKPVPESVQNQIAALKPDDVAGLAEVLSHQTKVNNKTSLADAVVNTFKAGMLTSVRMLERNDVGLATKIVSGKVRQQVSSAVDMLLGARSGVRTTVGLSPLRSLKNIKQTAIEVTPEIKAMMQGKFTPQMARESMDKFEFVRDQYTGDKIHNKALDFYVNSVFRIAGAIDLPFRKYNFMESIQDQARLTAMNEVKAGAIKRSEVAGRVKQLIANPTDAMTLQAGAFAEAMVYADKNMVATNINRLGNSLAKGSGKLFGPKGELAVKMGQASVMPFLKVPLNIAWDVLDKAVVSPYKVLDQAPGVVRNSIRKSLTPEQQQAFARAVGNGGVGFGAIIAGMVMAAKGLATGSSQSESEPSRLTNEVAGKQPGSILLGGKYRRIQDVGSPITNLFVLGASMQREWTKHIKDESKRPGNIAGAASNALLDNPFFQGVQDIVNIKENGPAKFLGQKAGAAVPAFVNDIGSLTDSVRRDTKPGPNDSFAKGVAKQVQGRLPGLRLGLGPRLNALGEQQPESVRNVFDATFPTAARDKSDKAVGELVRLDIGLQQPKRKPDENEQQFLARMKTNGDLLKGVLRQVVNSPNYSQATDKVKRTILESVVRRVPINR